mgnify:CR=1 FL=1
MRYYVSFLFCLYSISCICQSEVAYELIDTQGDIKLYSKKDTKSGFIEYKAELSSSRINFKDVLHIFSDYENHNTWIYNCLESKLLKRDSNEVYLYQTVKSTWPLKNRDYILRFTVNEVTETHVDLRYEAASHYIPDLNEYVRIEEMSGRWDVKTNGRATTVTMYGSFNPKLQIMPTIFQKKYVKLIPLSTLNKLSEKLLSIQN